MLSDINAHFSVVSETLTNPTNGVYITSVPLSSYIIAIRGNRNWNFIPITNYNSTTHWEVKGFDGTSLITGSTSFDFLVYTP